MAPQSFLHVYKTAEWLRLGKEYARQLAWQDGTEKIYLGCRNEERAKAAKLSLEESTGKSIFEIVLIGVSDLDSVRAAVESLTEPIQALVMNAGGMGGPNPGQKTAEGVTQSFSVNSWDTWFCWMSF